MSSPETVSQPLSMREIYQTLPLDFEGKAPKGANDVSKFVYRDIPFEDRLSKWKTPFTFDMRKLALKYWMGSEFDIAVIRREPNPNNNLGTTEIVHIFDDRVDMTIQLITEATWDPWSCWHVVHKKTNYIQLTSYLLTYFNAVFFDDVISQQSKVYFQRPLTNEPGDVLWIRPGGGEEYVYQKDDYWNPEVQAFYDQNNTPAEKPVATSQRLTRHLWSFAD